MTRWHPYAFRLGPGMRCVLCTETPLPQTLQGSIP
jgi:hypothetical protein